MLWGAVQGIVVVFERLCANMLCKIPRAIRIAATFLTTNFLWVLFRADSFENAAAVYRAMLNFRNPGFSAVTSLASDGTVTLPAVLSGIYIFSLLAALLAVVFSGKERIERTDTKGLSLKQAMAAAFCCALTLLCIGRESVFIYFNF